MDAANVDLKGFSEKFYKRLTLSHLEPVLDTLCWLKHSGKVWFEITNLIVFGENDSMSEIRSMCKWISENLGNEVPIHFTAFFPAYRLVDRPCTPPTTLHRAANEAREVGLKYVYVGNVLDPDGESTYCSKCGKCLIERSGHVIGEYRLDDNRCCYCGTVIPGVFETNKGVWRGNRLPVVVGHKP